MSLLPSGGYTEILLTQKILNYRNVLEKIDLSLYERLHRTSHNNQRFISAHCRYSERSKVMRGRVSADIWLCWSHPPSFLPEGSCSFLPSPESDTKRWLWSTRREGGYFTNRKQTLINKMISATSFTKKLKVAKNVFT